MAKRSRRCGHCGEVIKDGAPTRFDTIDPEAIYHERCFWGIMARRGWSFLQIVGGRPPLGLVVQCPVCDVDIHTQDEPTWYEADGGGRYRAYHRDCSPSKLD